MEGFIPFWKEAIEFLASKNTCESAVGALRQIVNGTDETERNISFIDATLPRARLLIDISESWSILYKPMEDLLPKLNEAVEEAQTKLNEFHSQRQKFEGANLTRFAGELVNDFKNWMLGFPENVKSAQSTLQHVCGEMENIYNKLNIPQNPNQVRKHISMLRATLPRARALIEISESWCFLYKPMEDPLLMLKEAVQEAQTKLDEFNSRRQAFEGTDWTRIPGEPDNDFKNWMLGFPENVESAKSTLDHVCDEMNNICSMLNIPETPNQFRKHISMLRATLPRARKLIERSECWRLLYNPINELLPQLKKIMYEAEFELADIDSMKRILEVHKLKLQGEHLSYLRKGICDLPGRVETSVGLLHCLCEQMEKECNDCKIPADPNQFSSTARPITTSAHPKIYGREGVLEEAICSLKVPKSGSSGTILAKKKNKSGLNIGESSTNTENKGKLAILPIVGMGGIGKTTLAQRIYNDERVESYFNLKAWICVSDKFNVIRLTQEILQCCATNEEDYNRTNLEYLQKKLKKVLESVRVLLVLDDIWSNEWHHLVGPISKASEGSAVILTTREPKYLECTGENVTILKSISLEGLEKNIYWKFFKSCAGLNDASTKNYFELADIAREICDKLKGSPLAAKTLGGLLIKAIDKNQWTTIRDSELWNLNQTEHDIIPALQLSYQYLPSHLKKCFSFCSLYPKDYEFTEIELAKLWIMQGFIQTEAHLKRMEDVALGYFHELKNSCFFHLKESPRKPYQVYVIHDLMHDVCQSLTSGECYCLENDNLEKIDPNLRHLSVFWKKLDRENLKKMGFEKLHSFLASPNCGITVIKSWCDKLTNIRRLSLSKCRIEYMPENIGNLKHLQYLDVSGTKIKKLPDSFCNLYNLQHLDMWECAMFSESGFPDGLNKLTGLQFFKPPLHLLAILAHMPNLLRAVQLYDLKLRVDEGFKIEYFKNLIGVCGSLDISELRRVSTKKAAEEAELIKKKFLDTLHLNWGSKEDDSRRVQIDREVFEGLRPHSILRELTIFSYCGQDLPSWMGDGLPNLRRFNFTSCLSHTVSRLPRSITQLLIQVCPMLNCLECLRPDLLPNLTYLSIYSCEKLVSLPVESFSKFVSLEKLVIQYCKLICPKTMVLPPSILDLSLGACGELENSIPSCLENLSSLERLSIENCPNLVSIPEKVMSNLTTLKSLHIINCPNLKSLGDEEFFKSIKDCVISKSPKLKETWGRNLDGRQLSAQGTTTSAAPSAPPTTPSLPDMPSIETETTGFTPGSSVTPSSLLMSSTATIDALAAAPPSSSNTISEMALIDQTPTTAQGAPASAAPSAPPSNPSVLQSIETPTTDDPSSSNPRKRKAGAQN